MQLRFVLAQFLLLCWTLLPPIAANATYRASPRLTGPAKLKHDPDDGILNSLDAALHKVTNVYTQALLSGTHSPELEIPLRALEMELYELLDRLYKQHRLGDYMRYEAEVTRQMIIYNMLKELFGYTRHSETTHEK